MRTRSTILSFLFTLFFLNQVMAQKNMSSVKIGDQLWMQRNLDVVVFRNGDTIHEAKTDEEWKNAAIEKRPAWCYYGNRLRNGKKYGKLYNWYAVNDSRGLAPVGWHIPNVLEWKKLSDAMGGDNSAGLRLKAHYGWKNDNGLGKEKSLFLALPGGNRDGLGDFFSIEERGCWWSANELNAYRAIYYSLYYGANNFAKMDYYKMDGFSVRCIKD